MTCRTPSGVNLRQLLESCGAVGATGPSPPLPRAQRRGCGLDLHENAVQVMENCVALDALLAS